MRKPATLPQAHQQALDSIHKSSGGKLPPEAIVKAATKTTHVLHKCFQWDDTVAGHEYRLNQARSLIARYTLVIAEWERGDPVRCYVAVQSSRGKDGGYLHIRDVMSDPKLRAELLNEAHTDAKAYRRKYALLEELRKVFEAMDEFNGE